MNNEEKEYLQSFISEDKDIYYHNRLTELLLRLIKQNDLEKLQFLKNLNIDIESNNYCALILSAREGNKELVDYFLSINSNINDKRNNNETIFDASVVSGNLELVKFLADKYHHQMQDPKLLFVAVDEGHLAIVQFLVETLKIDIHSTINYLDTKPSDCLPISIMRNNSDIFKYLISKGANIHQSDGYCLNVAINYDNLKIATYLIKNGLDINHLSSFDNKYPIEYAKNIKSIQFLSKNGVDININNSIALCSALKSYNVKLITLLMQHGSLYLDSFDKIDPPIPKSLKKMCQTLFLDYSLPKKTNVNRKKVKI